MLRFALLNYTPKRYMRRASFEAQESNRYIIDFKNGRKYAIRIITDMVCETLSKTNMDNTIIVNIPASCERTTERRYRTFMNDVCDRCGAVNGFGHVHVFGKREKSHIIRHHSHLDNVRIDNDFFRGRRVIVVDDICTTGQTSNSFIERLKMAGADVRMALFIAKTKKFKTN